MDVVLRVSVILLDFFLFSLGRNGVNLLDLPMLKLMMASPLYISIAYMSFERVLSCVMSSESRVPAFIARFPDGRAGLNRGIPIMTHG